VTDKQVYVTEAQEEAARLIAERNDARGTETSDSVLRIANADRRVTSDALAYEQLVTDMLTQAVMRYRDGRYVGPRELSRRSERGIASGTDWGEMGVDGAVELADGSRRGLVEIKLNKAEINAEEIEVLYSRLEQARRVYEAQRMLLITSRPLSSSAQDRRFPHMAWLQVTGWQDFDALVTAVGGMIGP